MQIGQLHSRLVFSFRLRDSSRQSRLTGITPSNVFYLLLIVLLFSPCAALTTYQQTTVDALLAFKNGVKNPPVLSSWIIGDPCKGKWKGVECSTIGKTRVITSLKLSNFGLDGTITPRLGDLITLTTLWLDSNSLRGPIPSDLGKLENLTSLRLANNSLNGSIPPSLTSLSNLRELYLSNNDLSGTVPFNASTAGVINIVVDGNNELCTLTPGFDLPVCGPSLAPALIFGPVASIPKSSKRGVHVAAIAGGVAGALALVIATIVLVSCCLLRAKSWPSATSDTGSSDPSAQVDWAKGPEGPIARSVAPESDTSKARYFSLEELEHATKKFSANNKIGRGGFGEVYKGLLEDGTIVAVKGRQGAATQDFQAAVEFLSRMRHKHLVNVLGFCQENDQQIVVYDYLPNGSVCGHLYDDNGAPVGKLDFRQRLAIALGAAKGLEYLHTTTPKLIHRDFKTSNVLLDAYLVAKVTDFGLSLLLAEGPHPQEGPVLSSLNGDGTAGFLDPEYYTTQRLTEKSDVYSFGVFLLELVSGREAISQDRPRSEWSLVEWGRSLLQAGDLGALVDRTLGSSFMEVAMRKMVEVGFHCVEETGDRRPSMAEVVKELEEALEKERGLTSGGGEGATTVTLGSELFT
ncbi:protein MpRLK-Pelle_RLCK-IXa [Marchantia polymorpha subsp. ruderalis]|uniref:Receptor-like kinase n=1 Tax=Marchantia polymorpha TaxID=3197 RepID=A7VM36_MARPO|nr:hypothetical protein MARPO_0122s0040 [Marchantia polymorpha]BAF79953.1 receptor-like kinase [Marchantia polymorpha]BBN02557.1 hypothetical protein Mp_2g16240 [Marchantia polymorpha subsp. ruderalis]|eukprot:PTQ30613.1 hypothetical protein MARPO_0122s0040 [Marchantia polymorpha]